MVEKLKGLFLNSGKKDVRTIGRKDVKFFT